MLDLQPGAGLLHLAPARPPGRAAAQEPAEEGAGSAALPAHA